MNALPLETAIFQAEFRQTAFGFNIDADYREVWREPNDGLDLDDVWRRFQRVEPEVLWPPDAYIGRSLSIGDVIVFDDGVQPRGWTPEPLGFRELSPEEVAAVVRGRTAVPCG